MQWLCVQSRSPVHIQWVPDVCAVGFTCAGVLDVPTLLMVHCDSSSDQDLVFCLQSGNPDIVLTFFMLWLGNIGVFLSGEQNGALGKLETISAGICGYFASGLIDQYCTSELILATFRHLEVRGQVGSTVNTGEGRGSWKCWVVFIHKCFSINGVSVQSFHQRGSADVSAVEET